MMTRALGMDGGQLLFVMLGTATTCVDLGLENPPRDKFLLWLFQNVLECSDAVGLSTGRASGP